MWVYRSGARIESIGRWPPFLDIEICTCTQYTEILILSDQVSRCFESFVSHAKKERFDRVSLLQVRISPDDLASDNGSNGFLHV